MEAEHLFGSQRGMLHRPAVAIEKIGCLRLDLAQTRGRHQCLFIVRVMAGVDGEGCRICGDAGLLGYQSMRNDPSSKDNRGQRPLRQAVKMLTHLSFEAQAPETSDIYTHDLVPFMPEHTPLILACHMALPIVQQLVALPRTAALPNSTSQLPCRIPWCPVPKKRTAARQQPAAHHCPQDVRQRKACSDKHP